MQSLTEEVENLKLSSERDKSLDKNWQFFVGLLLNFFTLERKVKDDFETKQIVKNNRKRPASVLDWPPIPFPVNRLTEFDLSIRKSMGGNKNQPPATPATTAPSYSVASFLENQHRVIQNYVHVNPNEPGTSRMGLLNPNYRPHLPIGSFYGSIDPRTYAPPGGSIVQGTPGHVMGRNMQLGLFDQRNISTPAMVDPNYTFGQGNSAMLPGFPLAAPQVPRLDNMTSLLAPGNLAHLMPGLRQFLPAAPSAPQLPQPSSSIFPPMPGNPLAILQNNSRMYAGMPTLSPYFAAEFQSLLANLGQTGNAHENDEVPAVTPGSSTGIASTPSPHSSQISPNFFASLQTPVRTPYTPDQQACLLTAMTQLHTVLRSMNPQAPIPALPTLPTPLVNPFSQPANSVNPTLPPTLEMPASGFRKPGNRKKAGRRVEVVPQPTDPVGFHQMLNLDLGAGSYGITGLADEGTLQRILDTLNPRQGGVAPAARPTDNIGADPSSIVDLLLPTPADPASLAPRNLLTVGTIHSPPVGSTASPEPTRQETDSADSGVETPPSSSRNELPYRPPSSRIEPTSRQSTFCQEAPCSPSTSHQQISIGRSPLWPPASTSAASPNHVDTQPGTPLPAAPNTPASSSSAILDERIAAPVLVTAARICSPDGDITRDDRASPDKKEKLEEVRRLIAESLGHPSGGSVKEPSPGTSIAAVASFSGPASANEDVASSMEANQRASGASEPIVCRRRDSTPVDGQTIARGSPDFVTSATSSSSIANSPAGTDPDTPVVRSLANTAAASPQEARSSVTSELYVDVSSPSASTAATAAANPEAPLVSSASTSSGENSISPPEQAPGLEAPAPIKKSTSKGNANRKPAKKAPAKKQPVVKTEPIDPASPNNSSTDATAFNSPPPRFLSPGILSPVKVEEEEGLSGIPEEEILQRATSKRKSSESKSKPKKKNPYVLKESAEDDLMVWCEQCQTEISIRNLDNHQRWEHEGASRRSSSTAAQAKIAAGSKTEQEGLKELEETSLNISGKNKKNKKNVTERVDSDDDGDHSYHGKLYRKDKRRRLSNVQ